MKILTLRLENFRAIKDATYDFEGKAAAIYGDNGTGKTTIANAILWLLTDQPETGEKDFTPKTAGTHELHHIAEMKVELEDGSIATFQKDFHEVWKKKRGSATKEFSGHVTDYCHNGVPTMKKTYGALMKDACGGDTERVLMTTILGYFAETMKSEDRRRVLFHVCGDVSDGKVIKENHLERLKDFLRIPGTEKDSYSIDEYKEIAKAERRKLNKQLEYLPERIDELEKGVPEPLADDEKEAFQKKLKGIQARREELKTDSPEVKREARTAAIAGLKAGIEKERARVMKEANEQNAEAFKIINDLETQLAETDKKYRSLTYEEEDVSTELTKANEKRQELLEEFDRVSKEQWDAGTGLCPTCGQPIPEHQLEEKKEAFLKKKTDRLQDINRRGQQYSKTVIEEHETKLKSLESELEKMGEEKKRLSDAINSARATVKEPVAYETTKEYLEAVKRISELRNANPDVNPNEEELADLEAQETEIRDKLAQDKAGAATRKRIDELKAEQADTAKNLEHVEEGIHLCEEFTRAKVRMVTENINSKFQTVSWLLFKEQINGGLKECCEPLIPNAAGQLVEYKSANTAARINAGLEIIETLDAHYGMHLPVIIDQAESVCHIRPMSEQTIRLVVSAEDKDLRIELE